MMVIYKITNKINDKIYIGQTNNFKRRIKQHTKEKFSRISLIKRAVEKYGKENFEVIILFKHENKDLINFAEEFFIRYFNSTQREFGYNIKLGGDNYTQSEETKRKIGEAQKGEKNHMYQKRGSLNKTSKPVQELKTGLIFESAMIASEYFGLNFSHICAVCRGERNSTGKYIFRYIDENNKIIETSRSKISRGRRIKNKTTGEIFNSFKEISETYNRNIDSGNIIKVIKGKAKTSYGYEWEYID